MTMLESGVAIDEEATAAYAHLFQALSDPQRLAIIQHLASGQHRVRDLVEHLRLAQSTVSGHVAFLYQCGLLAARPEGRSTWYSLAEPTLLQALMSTAESILSATGRHAQLCPHMRQSGEIPATGQKEE